jgi:hypothetical protein
MKTLYSVVFTVKVFLQIGTSKSYQNQSGLTVGIIVGTQVIARRVANTITKPLTLRRLRVICEKLLAKLHLQRPLDFSL